MLTSGVPIGCAGCTRHKGPRWPKGPLEARRVYLFKSKGVLGTTLEALHKGPYKPCYATDATSVC